MLTQTAKPRVCCAGLLIQSNTNGLAAMTVPSDNPVEAQALTFADIIKITDRIAETEGAQAADAALQRMARDYREAQAREAHGIVAASDTDDFDLGDLKAGLDEAEDYELRGALASLADLGADVEDTPKAGHEARAAALLATYATKNIEVRVTATPAVQGVAVAEKAKQTDREDLDLVLGDLEVGAGETGAEVIEHLEELEALAKVTPKAEGSVAATLAAAGGPNTTTLAEAAVAEEAERTDIDLNLVLADLEVGVGEPGYDKAIEHLDELDASAEDAVESAIAKAEAYESQPDKPTARTIEMLAYLAKQRKRGAARPAACEEFGVDPTDPMAPDKVRTAYKLKTVGKTLADLDNFHPAFWALPLETDDRSPSRKLVLSRFLWRRNDETKAKEKAAERQKKREAKGYRADYDDLSSKEKKRERDRLHKKWSRERVKALEAAGPSA
jgi:hypothetical protein